MTIPVGELELERFLRPAAPVVADPAAPLKSAAAVRRLLRSIGDQLGMDVAYIAELSDEQVFHFIEGDGASVKSVRVVASAATSKAMRLSSRAVWL